ncbi:SRPBCC family protein [Mycobacterium sp. MYCO198283]|uniref:SRPBCC family protein n=1 Tax=Mycobacterium sp. MYCO198283 TaxID=2883505 RepID=UPI001E3159FD|nr:SRPBCC family protein [Mycobacterium sp. MYCO198283]MCG5433641.1 SRPBCC family protein [Mycobacterium sp. MYCO198283]
MTNGLQLRVPVDTLAMEYTRDFDAPAHAVFRAHAEPDLVRQWLGPRGLDMDIERWDFRTGGGYRYTHRRDPDGEFVFNGVFHRVRENQLIIQTFEYEGVPDAVNIEFLRFADLDGRCRLHGRSVCPTVEALDGLVSSGAEHGMRESYERLEDLLG